jgi:hypothetical protein
MFRTQETQKKEAEGRLKARFFARPTHFCLFRLPAGETDC